MKITTATAATTMRFAHINIKTIGYCNTSSLFMYITEILWEIFKYIYTAITKGKFIIKKESQMQESPLFIQYISTKQSCKH